MHKGLAGGVSTTAINQGQLDLQVSPFLATPLTTSISFCFVDFLLWVQAFLHGLVSQLLFLPLF